MKAALADRLAAAGLPQNERALTGLVAYLELLQQFGRRTNLVGRLDWDFLIDDVVIGSLALLLAATPSGRLVDVGSGAGLPGIPLALCCPHLEVVLVEVRRKRVAFLEHARRGLKLNNAQVRSDDANTLHGAGFDWAVSRAFRPPQEWLQLAHSVITGPGGHAALYTTQEAHAQVSPLAHNDWSEIDCVVDPTDPRRVVGVYRSRGPDV